jgi:hypothetical protein
MRRNVVLITILVLLALGATPAWADVHLIAQAGCAPDGVASGAIGSRHAIDNGRPAAPIMVSASPFTAATHPGNTNSQAAPSGTNC